MVYMYNDGFFLDQCTDPVFFQKKNRISEEIRSRPDSVIWLYAARVC